MLFSEGRPPLVIDRSMFWRPPLLATAVVVALVWEGVRAAHV